MPNPSEITRKIDPARGAVMWPAVGLMILLAVWRVLLGWMTVAGKAHALPSWLPGLTPIAALAVGGGFLLPRRLALAVPLGTLLASDITLSAIYGQGMDAGLTAARYGGVVTMIALGIVIRSWRVGRGGMVAGTVVSSVIFYGLTNTAAWAGSADYAQSIAGWFQALTVGLPGLPPSWVFFRNSLVSDLVVSMLLAATCLPRARPEVPARQTLVPGATA